MQQEDKAFLIGVCIGDGSLRLDSRSKVVSFRLTHSIKQKEYFLFKINRIRAITKGNPCKVVEFNNNGYPGICWEKSHKYFRVIHKWLYNHNKKTITPFLLSKLTSEAVAVWWMDDGSMFKKRDAKTKKIKGIQGVLSTYISYEQNELIQKYFAETYEIHFSITKSKDKYRLWLNTGECRKLRNLILPYMHESLLYKVDVT